ncbi:hypothetical protein fugu_002469 [Takifugu bimaculatus]|uniref:Protein phosphatase 1 regulatory subunit 35 C-terminal domain-containing protein n=1 Tax=Takifugu bimaculatus TaxID=433685 RepID=A0A4Z2BPU1_9TELE|nr:hypothetical protein fugu_002469 [Takifugu bimaculatus]
MSSSPPPSPLPFSHSKILPFCSTLTFVSQSPELDLSTTLSPSSTPVKSSTRTEGEQGVKSTTSGRRKTSQLCFAQPVATLEPVLTPDTLPQRSNGAQKNKHHHRVPRQCIFTPTEVADHSLEEIRLNSTLALKKELQLLQETEFNSQKAIKETLQTSERTKVLMNIRTTDVVNLSRSQLLYNSLVNVDIQKDQFISQAVQERLPLAPHPCCHSNKEGDSPSHLIFLTPHLMRQQPFSSEEGTANSKLCPLPHSSHSAFDLYRRQTCHESLS